MNCDACGNEMSENAVFCPRCGLPIRRNNVITCGGCGLSVSTESNFCPKCGGRIGNGTKSQCSITFKLSSYKPFIAETKPFILKGGQIKIILDSEQEITIPPNPTKNIILPPGDHELFIYLEDIIFKQKKDKTYKKVTLEEGKNLMVTLKFPTFAWQEFQLIMEENKIL